MPSKKQIAANRRNAERSTGPKTAKGKRSSRMNAVKHGLTAETIVMPGENPEEFEALRQQVIEEASPGSVIETELVDRLAGILWRLRRIAPFEAAIWEYQRIRIEREDARIDAVVHSSECVEAMTELTDSLADPFFEGKPREVQRALVNAIDLDVDLHEQGKKPLARLGRALLTGANGLDALGKLTRYEADLMRNLERTLSQLEQLQANRMITVEPECEAVGREPVANTA